jgi:hypothetical protein
MDSLSKILKLFMLGLLILGPSGCATSDDDLNYTRKTIDDSSSDNSYHGWAAPPKEKSEYSQ